MNRTCRTSLIAATAVAFMTLNACDKKAKEAKPTVVTSANGAADPVKSEAKPVLKAKPAVAMKTSAEGEAKVAAKPAEPAAKPAEVAVKPADPGTRGAAPAAAPATPDAPAAPATNEALMDPSKLTETAPAVFKVTFTTTKGDFVVEAHRDWAPLGVDRFYNLVKNGFFTDIALFRVVKGFMAQFGIHGDPKLAGVWREARIQDDPVKQSNTRGMMTFAMAGPNTRTTQFFINFGDNSRLDGMNFPAFAKVVSGMDVVDKIYDGYGEGAPRGRGPHQGKLQMQGNAYLKADFPEMDYIKSAAITK